MRSRHYAAIAALLLCAHPPLASAQQRVQATPTPIAHSTLNPRLTPTPFGSQQATFELEAIGVKAIDESGPDWLGSDEVYAIIHPTATTGFETQTLVGIDTGETHYFAVPECFLPYTPPSAAHSVCQRATGVIGPISFELELYERDTLPIGFCPSTLPGNVAPCPDDDLIGKTTVSLSEAQLIERMPKAGDTEIIWIRLGGPCGWNEGRTLCGYSPYQPSGTGPEYLFVYRVTRMADTPGPRAAAPR